MTRLHVDLREVSPGERSALLLLAAGGSVSPESQALLEACRGEDPKGPVWFLSHCTDGVTWGRVGGNRLLTSCGKHPDWPTPVPSSANLIELRVFGPGAEVLLWRWGTAPDGLGGRLLTDIQAAKDDPRAPKGDVYLLAASRVLETCADEFSVVGEASGRVQVIPLAVSQAEFENARYPLGLELRHYFEEIPHSGCLRIAASRLVHLRRLAPKERTLIAP